MAITGWGNFRPLSALSLDAGPLPAPPGLHPGARFCARQCSRVGEISAIL